MTLHQTKSASMLLMAITWTVAPNTLHAHPPRFRIEHPSPVLSLVWSPDDKSIVAGTQDGTIFITDARTGKPLRTLPAKHVVVMAEYGSKNETRSFETRTAVTAMAISPDGNLLTAMSAIPLEKQMYSETGIYDFKTGIRFNTIAMTNYSGSLLQAFTPEGKSLISANRNYVSVSKWNDLSLTNEPVKVRNSQCMALSPDGLAYGWCDAVGQLLAVVQHGEKKQITALELGSANCMAFGPGGKILAVSGGRNEVHLWDLTSKKKTSSLTGLDKPAAKLAFSFDGSTLIALAEDRKSLCLWNLAHLTSRRRIIHSPARVGEFALSFDGKKLATTTSDGKSIHLWNTDVRELTHNGPPLDLSAKELAALWNDLADPDFDKADAAWRKLGAAGDNAVAFLQKQCRALLSGAVEKALIDSWVVELDSDKFATREKACKQLLAAGEFAVASLQILLERPPSLEAAKRANLILKQIPEPNLTPERLRVCDAIELLEQMPTSLAIGLLEEIVRDVPIALVNSEARQALQRIRQYR